MLRSAEPRPRRVQQRWRCNIKQHRSTLWRRGRRDRRRTLVARVFNEDRRRKVCLVGLRGDSVVVFPSCPHIVFFSDAASALRFGSAATGPTIEPSTTPTSVPSFSVAASMLSEVREPIGPPSVLSAAWQVNRHLSPSTLVLSSNTGGGSNNSSSGLRAAPPLQPATASADLLSDVRSPYPARTVSEELSLWLAATDSEPSLDSMM